MIVFATLFGTNLLRSLGLILTLIVANALDKAMATKEVRGTDYEFNGRISREVLENYLARSATVASLLT